MLVKLLLGAPLTDVVHVTVLAGGGQSAALVLRANEDNSCSLVFLLPRKALYHSWF